MTNGVDRDTPRSTTHRVVTATFGGFFVLLAAAIVLSVDGSMSVGQIVAAAALAALGADAIVSAIRRRRSLLERIGPLP